MATTNIKRAAASRVPSEPQERVPKPRHSIAEWAVTILILLFGTTTVAQPFVIPSGSMSNTLLTGDHVIVDKLAYSPTDPVSKHLLLYADVRRGDIIVFRSPAQNEDLVKRCIGLPGDHIKLIDKRVYVNGKPLDEPYIIHQNNSLPYRDNFPLGEPEFIRDPKMAALNQEMLRDHVVNGEAVVPDGSYFAMGDNRDDSLDSRYFGFVPRDNIMGKPLIVFWSYNAPTEDLLDYNLHHFVDLAAHLFTKTRWNRTLMLIRGYHDYPQS